MIKCYREYTRVIGEDVKAVPNNEARSACNYDAAVALVDNNIIGRQHCFSMETLMLEYSGSLGNWNARKKLKNRLQKSYEHKLAFLAPEYPYHMHLLTGNASTVK